MHIMEIKPLKMQTLRPQEHYSHSIVEGGFDEMS